MDSDLNETVTGRLQRHCGFVILPDQRFSQNNVLPAHVIQCRISQKPRRQSAATGMTYGFGLGYVPAIMPVVSLGIVIFAVLALYGGKLVFLVNNLMLMGEVQALRRADAVTWFSTCHILGHAKHAWRWPHCFLALRCIVPFSPHCRPFL